MDRLDIVTEARKWLGVPYRHQGRNRNGVDCMGLLVCVAQSLGFSNYDESGYSKNPSGMHMRNVLRDLLTEIPLIEAKAGDILHLKFAKQPQHLAIITGLSTIIHADSLVGKVVEHRMDTNWRSLVRGVYRVPRCN